MFDRLQAQRSFVATHHFHLIAFNGTTILGLLVGKISAEQRYLDSSVGHIADTPSRSHIQYSLKPKTTKRLLKSRGGNHQHTPTHYKPTTM
jgi:hypothetical protein